MDAPPEVCTRPVSSMHPPTRSMHPPPGSMHQKTDGQQAGGTHPTGMHSCLRKDRLYMHVNLG